MKKIFGFLIMALLILTLAGTARAANITILHDFGGIANADGALPITSLVLSADGNTLYGATYNGATDSDDMGVFFKINTDGSGYQILHDFDGGAGDGTNPVGSLLRSGNMIYGTSPYGGEHGYGTVYKYNLGTGAFSTVYEFESSEGYNHIGGVTLAGSVLYGTADYGGTSDAGTIYKVNTDGTGFTVLHNFSGGADDGQNPYSELLYFNNKLYGTTYLGGANYVGNIYSINTDGTGYTNIYEFDGTDGNGPFGTLIAGTDGMLYGTTGWGADGSGSVFRINPDGSGFEVLHEFAAGGSEGSFVYLGGMMWTPDGRLLGTTYEGGLGGGTIFSMDRDGTGFSVLHEFAGGSDGWGPQAMHLILDSDNRYYGVTMFGGASNLGTVYSGQYVTPEPATVVSGLIGLLGLAAKRLVKRKNRSVKRSA